MKIENFKHVLSLTNGLKILLIVFMLTGAFLRVYNLNWGAPFYFHPDERNISSVVDRLEFPNQMNPQFFAYGSLPIYIIYFTGLLTNFLTTCHLSLAACHVSFEQAILISRFYSALFSVILIPLLFVIARSIATKQSHEIATLSFGKLRIARNDALGLLAAFLATTSVGFIQFSHFGTFEMWLTFFATLLFWLCLQKINKPNILLMGIVFGILVSTKISSLALLPLPLLALIFKEFQTKHPKSDSHIQLHNSRLSPLTSHLIFKLLSFLKNTLLLLITSALVYVFTNPYVFFDTKSFLSTIQYESSVGLGTFKVFYTGEFEQTIPILFQLQNVYPFLLNPLITILFIPSFIYLFYKMFKTKSFPLLLLASCFLLLLVSQAFLFVKWTRYMVPTLPFIYLMVAITIVDLLKPYSSSERRESRSSNTTMKQFNNSSRQARTIIINSTLTIFAAINLIFALSYFITAFVETDTRIAAKHFALQTIPSNAPILSEVYDLGIIAFNGSFNRIELFNFYDLESNPLLHQELPMKIANSEYIILPSQRLLKIRLLNKDTFPKGHDFYQSLVSGKLGYRQIYQSPCSIFCRITYLGDSVFRYEETASVFDKPTVFIFQKNEVRNEKWEAGK